MEKKIYRVLITESLSFHHDIEAVSIQDAMDKTRQGIDYSGSDIDLQIVPVEETTYSEGYIVHDAIEITHAESDLA